MTVPRKIHYGSKWRRDQDAAYWIKLKKAQDLELQFWQTKSNATLVHNPVLLECIFKFVAKMDKKYHPRLPFAVAGKVQQQQQQQQVRHSFGWSNAIWVYMVRPTQQIINEIQDRFSQLCRPQWKVVIQSRGMKYGPQPWQEMHKRAKDALRGAMKNGKKRDEEWTILDRWS